MPATTTRIPLTAVVLSLAVVLGVLPAAADPLTEQLQDVVPVGQPIPAGVFTSDNVEWYGTVPLDHPGVGGQVVERDGTRYFYVTGAYGLGIYDTTDPAQPQLVSRLVFPHSQNEDLKVSEDGTRAVIAADGSLPYSPNYVSTGVHVVNIDDITNPFVEATTASTLSPAVTTPAGVSAGFAAQGASEHTVACADAACTVIYGSSGRIYDATEPGTITATGDMWSVVPDGDGGTRTIGGRHALNRDASGLLISDSHPRLVLATTPEHHPDADPFNPVVLAEGTRSDADNLLQHNNLRIGAEEWVSRGSGSRAPLEGVPTEQVEPTDSRSISVVGDRPVMKPGELLIGTSETNVNPQCGSGGGLSTWSMVDFDLGAPMQQLEVFRPYNGTWADGSPPANAAGCSAHWFTERDGIVAAAWYEHGTHFFDVDHTTGTIEEVGFFQSVSGISSAAYWIDDEFVYTVDGTRGFDIIRFDREADAPDSDQLTGAWLRSLTFHNPYAEQLREFCRLAAQN